METWNREELYNEVWEQPLVKIASKYGISAVALGKVCRKLQIPLPGRGYWTKKEFGKPVERLPLPEGKDLPVVQRFKFPPEPGSPVALSASAEAAPRDPEFLRIVKFESRSARVEQDARWHKLVKDAEQILSRATADERSILQPRYDQPCLDLRVSKGSLKRALAFINAVILLLESERFPVTVRPERHGTEAQIFGHRVQFAIVEKIREVGRREVKEYSWTKTIIEYEPSGQLEFRYGVYAYGRKHRDGKKQQLETLLKTCVASLMHEGRASLMSAKLAEQRKLEREVKERERAVLAGQIAEEEKKVRDLDAWVTNWVRAQQIRDFVNALEKVWTQQGHDLAPGTPKGLRIVWMKEQADRVDPTLPSPPSILDRKSELCS